MTDLATVQRPGDHLARLLATFIEGKRAGRGVPLPTKWHRAPKGDGRGPLTV